MNKKLSKKCMWQINMSFSERIKYLKGGMSARTFADSIGISTGALSNYENGKSIPKERVASFICERLGVRAEWLLKGEGEPYCVGGEPSFSPESVAHKAAPASVALPDDLLGKYIACLEELNGRHREVEELRKENTDLRVEVERQKGKIAELESALADAAEEPPRTSPVNLRAAG